MRHRSTRSSPRKLQPTIHIPSHLLWHESSSSYKPFIPWAIAERAAATAARSTGPRASPSDSSSPSTVPSAAVFDDGFTLAGAAGSDWAGPAGNGSRYDGSSRFGAVPSTSRRPLLVQAPYATNRFRTMVSASTHSVRCPTFRPGDTSATSSPLDWLATHRFRCDLIFIVTRATCAERQAMTLLLADTPLTSKKRLTMPSTENTVQTARAMPRR